MVGSVKPCYIISFKMAQPLLICYWKGLSWLPNVPGWRSNFSSPKTRVLVMLSSPFCVKTSLSTQRAQVFYVFTQPADELLVYYTSFTLSLATVFVLMEI